MPIFHETKFQRSGQVKKSKTVATQWIVRRIAPWNQGTYARGLTLAIAAITFFWLGAAALAQTGQGILSGIV
jgi:hypothetical protein